jgi:hypothetical protein
MEEVSLKIEMNNYEDLEEFRNFLYEEDAEMTPLEMYDYSPGFNKEPIVISIILALGGKEIVKRLQQIMDKYFAYKTEKLKTQLATQKEIDRHREELFKLSLKKGNSEYKIISQDEFSSLEIKS